MRPTQKLVPGLLLGCLLVVSQGCSLKVAEAPNTKAFTVAVTGSGRPMILIPGLACGGDIWDDSVAHFKSTYQCHVVTLAGFAGQPGIGSPYLDRVRAALISYIRDQKLERPVIIGHSLGGFMALSLAASIPDQVGPIISVDGVPFGAALKDTNATPQSSLLPAQLVRTVIDLQTRRGFVAGDRKILAWIIANPKEAGRIADSSGKSDPKTVGQALYELMTTDLRPRLAAIRSPVLLMLANDAWVDPQDRKKVGENARLEVAGIPNCQVVQAAKAGHFIMLDDPQYFTQAVEAFLKTAE